MATIGRAWCDKKNPRIVRWKVRHADGFVEPKQITFPKGKDAAKLARIYRDDHNANIGRRMANCIIPITLRDAGGEFIEALNCRADDTLRQYANSIAVLGSVLGNPDVCEIGGANIDEFIAARMEVSREPTVAKHCRQLKRFFNWCIERDYAEKDSNAVKRATGLPRNGIAAKRPRLTNEQFAGIIENLDSADRKLAVLIGGTTALDRGVVRSLAPVDVNFETRHFDIERVKTHRDMAIPIHDTILADLHQRSSQIELAEQFFSGLSHQGGASDWMKRATRAAGVEWCNFCDIRKYGLRYLNHALGLMDASRSMGHSTVSVTLRHYAQINPQAQESISALPLPCSARNGKEGEPCSP